jgi:hypothetical protein
VFIVVDSSFWTYNPNTSDWALTSIISAPGPTGWTGSTGPTGIGATGPVGLTGLTGPTGKIVFNFRGTVPSSSSLGRITIPKTGDLAYVVDVQSYYVYDEYDSSWTATAFGYTGPTGSFSSSGDIITSGNMWINNITATGTINSVTDINAIGNISATGTISSIGDITTQANMSCVALTETSDVRYKSEIETIADPLDKIRRMRGVYFQMNSRRRTGVIAQETEAVLPEVVYTDSSAERRKSVDYGNIVGILIEGIKALDERLAALEKKESTE